MCGDVDTSKRGCSNLGSNPSPAKVSRISILYLSQGLPATTYLEFAVDPLSYCKLADDDEFRGTPAEDVRVNMRYARVSYSATAVVKAVRSAPESGREHFSPVGRANWTILVTRCCPRETLLEMASCFVPTREGKGSECVYQFEILCD